MLAWLQREYIDEARSWESDEELAGLMEAARGRRRFQGFGAVHAQKEKEEGGMHAEQRMDSEAPQELRPVALRRVSGGSCRGKRERPACPFCGGQLELLRRTVSADEVERVPGGWVWKGPRSAVAR